MVGHAATTSAHAVLLLPVVGQWIWALFLPAAGPGLAVIMRLHQGCACGDTLWACVSPPMPVTTNRPKKRMLPGRN